MKHKKLAESHEISPYLYVFLSPLKKLSSNLKSAFSDVFCKMSRMQNRKESWSWTNILLSMWEACIFVTSPGWQA